MATTNHERVGKAMDLLKSGLGPFVEREFKSAYKDRRRPRLGRFMGEDRLNAKRPVAEWDVAALLKLMWEVLERCLPQDAWARRAQSGQRAARPPQQVGAPADILERRRLPRARLGRAAADRRLGAAGGRDREDEDGASAPALRRAGAQREAQERGHGDRERGGRRASSPGARS